MVVQEPVDALVPGMPSSAIAAGRAARRRARHGDSDALVAPAWIDADVAMPRPPRAGDGRPGPAQGRRVRLHVPGVQRRAVGAREGELVRYRCRVGHAYSEEAMVEAQGGAVEARCGPALKVLEERGELLGRIADRIG